MDHAHPHEAGAFRHPPDEQQDQDGDDAADHDLDDIPVGFCAAGRRAAKIASMNATQIAPIIRMLATARDPSSIC